MLKLQIVKNSPGVLVKVLLKVYEITKPPVMFIAFVLSEKTVIRSE